MAFDTEIRIWLTDCSYHARLLQRDWELDEEQYRTDPKTGEVRKDLATKVLDGLTLYPISSKAKSVAGELKKHATQLQKAKENIGYLAKEIHRVVLQWEALYAPKKDDSEEEKK